MQGFRPLLSVSWCGEGYRFQRGAYGHADAGGAGHWGWAAPCWPCFAPMQKRRGLHTMHAGISAENPQAVEFHTVCGFQHPCGPARGGVQVRALDRSGVDAKTALTAGPCFSVKAAHPCHSGPAYLTRSVPLASGEGLSAVFDRLRTPPDRSVAFTIAVIALGAKMAKADGEVTRDEVTAFREVYSTFRRHRGGQRRPGVQPCPPRYRRVRGLRGSGLARCMTAIQHRFAT